MALNEKFKADHIVDVMLGKSTAAIKTYDHKGLEVFGCLEGSDAKTLNTVIRQAILEGYLDRDIENFGIIQLTDKGKNIIKSRHHSKLLKIPTLPTKNLNP